MVDNADRLCTAELHGIIADGTSRLAKVILVEGGTGPAPSQHVGPAFNRLRALLPAVDPGTTVATVGPSAPVRGGFDQTVAVASTSQDALNALVADWADVRAGSRPAVMVALGAEEAEALNSLARQLLAGRGRLHGPGGDRRGAGVAGGRRAAGAPPAPAVRAGRRPELSATSPASTRPPAP